MVYKPLDLSFIAPRTSIEGESVRNTAAMIMANAGWSKPSQVTLKEIAKLNKESKAANRQTALSSLFDLLSTPLYGVANAMDEALAGHQSDPNDSVVEDIGKTIGGVFTGAGRGIGAGLRGASGLLDAVPGVDINDEWQSDKSDKTHFSDVAIRKTTGMSTADAMKPENWDEVKGILDKVNQKSMWDKTFFELAIPDDLDSPDAREDYFRNQMLTGIASDIGGDPLNFLLPGFGAARKGAQVSKELTEGLDAARAGNPADEAILKGLDVKATDRIPVKPDINSTPPVGIIGQTPDFVPKSSVKAAKPASEVPPNLAISPEDQIGVAEQIAKMMRSGGGWSYRVGSYLNYAFEGVRFPNTHKFLDDINEVQKTLGTSPSQEELVRSLTKTLSDDVMIAAGHSADEAGEAAAKVGDAVPPAAIGDKGKYKTLAGIGRRELPKQGIVLGGADQAKVVKQIVNLASSGKKNWKYEAARILAAHPKVQWTKTEELLERASQVIKEVGHRGAEGLAPALRNRVADDVKNTKIPVEVERRLSNELRAEEIGLRVGPKLKVKEAQLANRVVRKFENEILGRGRAPGTYEGLAKAIARGDNVRYSGPQQARMWNLITTNLKFGNAAKYDKAVRILRSVEDYFITKGMIPQSAAKTAESVPLRLSEVAEALGPRFLGSSHAFITGILRGDPKALAQLSEEQINALQALRAKGAVEAAPAVNRGIGSGKQILEEIDRSKLSAGRAKDLINKAIDSAKLVTAKLGGGDSGARVTDAYLSNLTGRNNPVEGVLRSQKLKTEAWLGTTGKSPVHGPRNVRMGAGKGAGKVGGKASGAVNDPNFVRSVTNAISRAADLPPSSRLGGVSGTAALVKEWLGARFNAAYGVQDMRPIYLREQGSALSTVGRRARLLNNLARTFDPKDADLWHEAMRAAQQNGVSSGQVAKLQSEIAKVMENLFGGTGLRTGAIADSTVVGRNRLLLDELNSNLRRFGLPEYQFVAQKVKDAAGVERDFSKGIDWTKSWEVWDIKDPYKFLHQVQNAVEHTVREKNMFDEIISRFASPHRSDDVKYGVNHPRLRGYFFTEEGARQAQQFAKLLEEVSTPNAKSLQYFDNVLSKLKASLTIYIPGHHWTNLIGDIYFNWIAGVNKPIRYEQAMKTMLAQKGRYGEFAEIGTRSANSFEALAGPQALEQAVARSVLNEGDSGLKIPAAGNKVIVTMPNGTKVTADMIYTAAYREGILPSARVLEEVASDVSTVLDKFRPLGGKGQRAVHTISEVRDHIPRLAQFIDGIAKSKASFTNAASASARSVRKWHPDGIDLTKFERNFMKRVFPFYSWTRKAIPLAIESVIFAGPKVMAYPRLMEAIALNNGISPNNQTTDMFPTDQMFPDWVRDRGIGPIMGGAGAYRVINPSTPVLDIMAMLGHPGQTTVDMLNPMMKVPIEMGQGQTLGRNVPIGHTNEQWLDYMAKQIPVVSQAGRVSGQFGVSESTKSEGFPNTTNILNLLTGAKAVDTGKYQKSAQFDLREYFKKKAEQNFR
jgi:hypothetical protein